MLRARDMLALVQDSAVVYADDINCGVGHPRSNGTGEQTEERLWVYPNPAREHLTIEYRFADKMERCLLLHNALGQLVRRLSLPDGAGKVQISTDNLPAGVYWYTVPSSLSRSTASGKIILND